MLKNENNREDMLDILKTLHKYVPSKPGTEGLYFYITIMELYFTLMIEVSTLLFMGDQLTVERARNTAKSRVNAPSALEALEGLQPAVCDWHAECIFLQVRISLH